jgi:putative membrane protein
LQIETSQHAGLLDPLASKQVAQATMATLNTQVVQTYLDNIYIGFNTIHNQLNTAADGADQLAGGTGKLSSGARSLAGGATQLNTAAHQLSSGASQLASGTSTLSGGLTQAEKETASLPALTQQLAAGARQVANGNKQLAAAIVPLANKVIHAIDTLPSAQAAAARFQQLAAQCQSQDPNFCRQLQQVANRFSADAKLIDGSRTSIRAAAVAIKNNIQALASGAEQVAGGTALLASKSGQLAGGIASAAGGARKLDTGAHQLSSGAGQLAAGTAALSSGAGQLASGVASANAGAQKLSSGLDSGRDQIPSYDAKQRAHLKTVAATPVGAEATGATDFGRTAAALFIALALWCCALATYVITRAVPSSILMSREPTWRTIFYAAQPGVAVAVIAAAVLSLVFIPILGLGWGRSLSFFLVTLLAALTFAAINQAIVAIFQRPGRFAAIAIMLLTLATGIVSTVPAVFSAVESVLPTHGAVEALRAIATGTGGITAGVAELLGWLVLGLIASFVVTDRRRMLPAAHLRLSAARG